MADMHYSQNVGHADRGGRAPYGDTSTAPSNPLKMAANLAGAAISLALVAGVAVWGYNLVMRDVSGIPVVRATAGDMRVLPSDPGGKLAQNTGLAVNEVAAAGSASGPVDQVTLAPAAVDLHADDQPMIAPSVAPVQQPAPLDVAASLDRAPIAAPVDVARALGEGNVADLVAQLTDGVDTIDAGDGETVPVLASVSAADVTAALQEASVAAVRGPGPSQSPRPQLRPANAPDAVLTVAATATITAPTTTTDIDADTIPAGTRLVQLGAFDTPEIARAQWDRMQGRFGDYMAGKDRIVQTAESGGRTFYRLRAHGFADLSDARRFCSALVSEGADCIPVVTR